MSDLSTAKDHDGDMFVDLADVADVPEGGNRAFGLDGRSILVCRSGGEMYAFANRCPHALSPLEGGRVRARTIFCPLHGARFDISNGRSLNSLTDRPLRLYPLRIRDGRIEVAVPDGDEAEDLPAF